MGWPQVCYEMCPEELEHRDAGARLKFLIHGLFEWHPSLNVTGQGKACVICHSMSPDVMTVVITLVLFSPTPASRIMHSQEETRVGPLL